MIPHEVPHVRMVEAQFDERAGLQSTCTPSSPYDQTWWSTSPNDSALRVAIWHYTVSIDAHPVGAWAHQWRTPSIPNGHGFTSNTDKKHMAIPWTNHESWLFQPSPGNNHCQALSCVILVESFLLSVHSLNASHQH